MFYAAEILSRDGRFGHIWLAAHMDKKLTKTQIFGVKIPAVVDEIMDKHAESTGLKISLRTSSLLMLGVVKIYQRKMQYLFHDCSETVYKIKTAFRHTNVDLPADQTMAPFHSITMQDTEGDLSATLRLTNIDFSLNETAFNLTLNSNTRADASQIQLRDSRSQLTRMSNLSLDDGGFGMADLDESLLVTPLTIDPIRHATTRQSIESDIMFHNDAPPMYDMPDLGFGEPSNAAAPMDTTIASEANVSKLDQHPDERPTPSQAGKRRKMVYLADTALQIDRKEYAKWQERASDELQRPMKRAAVTVVTSLTDPNWMDISLMNPRARAFVKRARAPLLLVERPRAEPIPLAVRSPTKGAAPTAEAPPAEEAPNAPYDAGMDAPQDFNNFDTSFGGGPDISFNMDYSTAGAADEMRIDLAHRSASAPAEEEEPDLTDAQRVQKVQGLLKTKFDETGESQLGFSDFVKKNSRKATAAGLFYELLVLKTKGMIDVAQQEPYGEIEIHKTDALVA